MDWRAIGAQAPKAVEGLSRPEVRDRHLPRAVGLANGAPSIVHRDLLQGGLMSLDPLECPEPAGRLVADPQRVAMVGEASCERRF